MSQPTRNGMPATDPAGVMWRKSRRSGQIGNCVETAAQPGGEVAMRNSRDPGGPALIFTRLVALSETVRRGDPVPAGWWSP